MYVYLILYYSNVQNLNDNWLRLGNFELLITSFFIHFALITIPIDFLINDGKNIKGMLRCMLIDFPSVFSYY